MENTFKSSVFGGFNRDDVIRYIEKTALESKQQYEQLEKENDGLCRENAELRNELAAVTGARDRLSTAYGGAIDAQESQKKELTELREELTLLRAQKEEAERALAELREQSARELREVKEQAERELAELRPQIDEFARVKAHVAEIEFSARERADALETATRARLQDLIGACSAQCELMLSTLGTTCANVSGELRRTDAMVSQLPAAFNTLRTDLKELQKLEDE